MEAGTVTATHAAEMKIAREVFTTVANICETDGRISILSIARTLFRPRLHKPFAD